MKKNTSVEFPSYMDKLRLKCIEDLCKLAALDKDWNPETKAEVFRRLEA